MEPTIKWHKSSDLKPKSALPPSDFVSSSERSVKAAAQMMVQQKKVNADIIGERPYGTKKISERQQVRRYLTVRDDPQAWTQLIQDHGLKATVEYALRLERLLEKYPDERDYLNPVKEQ